MPVLILNLHVCNFELCEDGLTFSVCLFLRSEARDRGVAQGLQFFVRLLEGRGHSPLHPASKNCPARDHAQKETLRLQVSTFTFMVLELIFVVIFDLMTLLCKGGTFIGRPG